MVDIFLSYADEDREAARALAGILDAAGWTVWSEREIPPGIDWQSAREEGLKAARCILILLSAQSVKSSGLLEEAAEARRRSARVIPVQLDPLELPTEFRAVSAVDLTDWDRATVTWGVRQLIADLERNLRRSGQRASPAPAPSHPQRAKEGYDRAPPPYPSPAPARARPPAKVLRVAH